MGKHITVVVKPGQTFKGVTYYEPAKFDVSPEYAAHLMEAGIVQSLIRPFRIVAMNPADGTEEYRDYDASCLSEALGMAERDDAGRADRIYGICPEDYALAREEGIAFNEADGLLINEA